VIGENLEGGGGGGAKKPERVISGKVVKESSLIKVNSNRGVKEARKNGGEKKSHTKKKKEGHGKYGPGRSSLKKVSKKERKKNMEGERTLRQKTPHTGIETTPNAETSSLK